MEEKEKRIKKEKLRLKKIFKDIDKKKLDTVEGLIQRVAFLRITLEDLEDDLNKNGVYEMFTQSEKTEPYQRKRPSAEVYNNLITQYQKITKQLTDLLPDEVKVEELSRTEESVNYHVLFRLVEK